MPKTILGDIVSTKAVLTAAVVSVLALAAPAGAQAATGKIKVVETVQIDAPPAKVWSVIGDFSAPGWHPAAKSTTTSEGNAKGSQRHIDLGGATLVEQLVRHNPEKLTFTYKILDNGTNQKILPVKGYISTIQVKPAGTGSVVVWSSKFDAAAGADPAKAEQTIHEVYRGGLDNLVKVVAKP